MNQEKRENIKVGLLGLLAITLLVNTYFQIIGSKKRIIAQNGSGANPNPTEMTNQPSMPDANGIYPEKKFDVNPQNKSVDVQSMEQPPQPSKPSGPPTSVNFKETNHSFGKIKQDTQNKYLFKFTNTGTNPLIIENAAGSCGCTVPNYPKQPIPPGGKGEIEVVYSPGKQQGQQNKTVTVTANTEPTQTILNISAEVEPVQETRKEN